MRKFAMLMASRHDGGVFGSVMVPADVPAKVTVKECAEDEAGVTFDHKAPRGQDRKVRGVPPQGRGGKEQKCFNCHKARRRATRSL